MKRRSHINVRCVMPIFLKIWKSILIQFHQGKKPHLWFLCGYSAAVRNTLQQHIEFVHEGKKLHMCSLCGTSFALLQNLKSHIRLINKSYNAMSVISPLNDKIRINYKMLTANGKSENLEGHKDITKKVFPSDEKIENPFSCWLCDQRFWRNYKLIIKRQLVVLLFWFW